MRKMLSRLVVVAGILALSASALLQSSPAQATAGVICQNVQGTACRLEGSTRGCANNQTGDAGTCTCTLGFWDCGV